MSRVIQAMTGMGISRDMALLICEMSAAITGDQGGGIGEPVRLVRQRARRLGPLKRGKPRPARSSRNQRSRLS